jgi:hypothetical protein
VTAHAVRRRAWLALPAGVVLALGVTACAGGAGGPSSGVVSTGAGTTASSGSGTTTAGAAAGGGVSIPERTVTRPSASTSRTSEGDGSIQTFGGAGSPSELATVTRFVKAYYAAAGAGDGKRACALLSRSIQRSIAGSLGRAMSPPSKDCARILSLYFAPQAGATDAHIATVAVTGLRVRGNLGYALITTKTIPSGEIPLARESGVWKLAALLGSPLQ